MKHFYFIFLVGTWIMGTNSVAFGQIESKNQLIPVIEVTGVAELEVVPNEIYVTITISEQTHEKEVISVAQQEQQLKQVVQNVGIPFENLSLTDSEGSTIKIKRKVFTVHTSNDYLLKASNAQEIQLVFNQLDSLGIQNFRISHVNHTKLDSIRAANRVAAIQAAKNKADYLLNTIGETTGRALFVREDNVNNSSLNSYLNIRGSRSINEYYIDGVKVRGVINQEIEFQKIKVQSSIYVKFEILQQPN